ncbi:hypothetical protein ACIA5C_48405 [Actinoplanes sp. NPDC051343]|uniref:hypothetical protein n=1 Tax=Actinoplanes sp. NPDC051343 TaxID=3363906 RepID=UPI0037BB8426
MLALSAAGGGSNQVRAVDLGTGTVLSDRSLLRYEEHEALALGVGYGGLSMRWHSRFGSGHM